MKDYTELELIEMAKNDRLREIAEKLEAVKLLLLGILLATWVIIFIIAIGGC